MTRPFLTAVALLAACVLVATVRGQASSGFSVVSGKDLWTFGDPSSLDMFSPHVLSLPFTATSAAATAERGGFVVVGEGSIAAYNLTSFVLAANYNSTYLLADVAFIPTTENVAALGAELGTVANTAALFLSRDGGLTWAAPSLTDWSRSKAGSISFADADYGVAALGGSIYKTTSGDQWARVYFDSQLQKTITKVVAFSPNLTVATGLEGVFTSSSFGLVSNDAGDTWSALSLPAFSSSVSVSGLVLVDAQTWFLSTSGGEIWRTADGAKSWSRTLSASNISWSDIAYNRDWKVFLAAGSYPLASSVPGVLALSYNGGSDWSLSSPQPGVSFSRVVPHVPLAIQSASPSPSISPSVPVLPSATPSPSVSPSSHPASPTPSPSPSPHKDSTPSASASASLLPATPSPSPSKHSASPTPSPSPSKHSASPTPSASPSKHSASPTRSASPSKGSSPSPSPSAGKKKDDSNTKLALGLGLGLGLGGGAVLLAGVGFAYFWRKRNASRNVYQPINASDV